MNSLVASKPQSLIASQPHSLTALILAGGLGTRLRPAVSDGPKVMAEVAGRPFLHHLLARLAACGVRDVILCTGYMGERVAELGSSFDGMKLRYSCENTPLGTGGAIRNALPIITSDPVLVLNGDSFCTADLRAFCAWHHAHGAAGSLLLTACDDVSRYGSVEVAEDGRVVRYREKNEAGGPGWINAGVYLLGRGVIESIPAGRAVSIEHEIFPAWVGQGLFAWRSPGALLDIGTPDSYATAERFLCEHVAGA